MLRIDLKDGNSQTRESSSITGMRRWDTRMAFRSKIDWWLVILVLAVPGWHIAADWAKRGIEHPPVSLWVVLAVLGVVGITLVPTRYIIEGRTISIQCGLMGWEYSAFTVEDVQSIRPTHNPLSSPALSLDRLKIELNSGKAILISPRDKTGFLRAINALEPQLRSASHSLVRSG
jgi:hypothetical protein